MEPTSSPRIKICCIQSIEEARLAIDAGASALGLVSEMPSGPGVIEEERIIEIAARVPPPVATFLLTSEQDADEIAGQQRRCKVDTLQLCDSLERGSYRELRAALPGVRLVQVIHVTGPASLDQALSVAGEVDALLLDSGNPLARIKELGGTGRLHDWSVSRSIREASPVPVFLAGGLNPDNVARAVSEVGPFGLDVCSGVRTNGKLDPRKLALFFERARSSPAAAAARRSFTT